MNTPLAPPPPSGNSRQTYIDYPGPPKFEGAEDGQLVLDKREMGWVWRDHRWEGKSMHKQIYVVVDAPGAFAMPRAWAFEDEREAVEFRLKRLNDTNRRPGTCHPVIAIPLGSPHHCGFNEIEWAKYAAPKAEGSKKWS